MIHYTFQEEAEIEDELADVTFEELLKARADGSISLHQKLKSETRSKRANKNRYDNLTSSIYFFYLLLFF